jgi:hypothetical protein
MNGRIICGLLLVSVAVVGQQTPTKPKAASVAGIVTRDGTGEPIPDVQVTATASSPEGAPKSATSDAEGRFVISDLAPGRYTINAVRTLFVRARRNSASLSVNLTADEHLRALNIRLQPTAVISGRIFDENRQPLRAVRVEALYYQYRDGVRVLSVVGQGQSDDRGEYRVFNLQPDTYYVRAALPGSGAQTAAAIYYPGAVDSLDAVALKAGPGAELNAVDLSFTGAQTYSVRFKIVSSSPIAANPLLRFVAVRTDRANPVSVSAQPESLGDSTYRISNLAPGAYDIYVQSRPGPTDVQKIYQSGRMSVNVGKEDSVAGTVALRPAGTLVARLIPTESLAVTVNPSVAAILLRPMDGLPTDFSTNSRSLGGSATEDGVFTIPNVINGRFRVEVTGLPANVYLTGARYGAADVLDTGMNIDADPQGPLELFLGGAGSVGSVEGVVRDKDEQPVPDSVVALIPAPNRRGNPTAFKTATTDQLGLFSIRGVLPGDYTVLAWDDIEAGAYQNPDFLKDFEKRGSRITVERGGSNSLSIRVIQ